ncbi:MAG: redoxin family protein [bacterium]
MLALSSIVAATLLALPQSGTAATATTATTTKPPQAAQAVAAPVGKLSIGDPAPKLQYDEWIKGDKVDGIEKGKVHVIEFWATWCGPCITAMPHLSELQKKHPEAIVVSVAASERGADEAAKVSKVRTFVEGKGDTMGYRVVYAGDREKMSKPWMQAAGQNGIPCAFIVDKDANIAWIGHPMSMDAPLAGVLDGTWDAAAAKKAQDAERAAMEMQRGVSMALREARQSGDYSKAIDSIRKALAIAPSDAMKLQLFGILAGPGKQPDEAWKIGEEIFAAKKDDPAAMNGLAWMIVDPDAGVEKPNLDLAMRAAEAAVKNSKGAEGAMLDTLARVVYLKGDIERAIEIQKDAIAKTPAGTMREGMEKSLAEYESALKKA